MGSRTVVEDMLTAIKKLKRGSLNSQKVSF